MCVAIVVPNGVEIPPDLSLIACYTVNPHGAGIAWVDTGKKRVLYQKGLDMNEFFLALHEFKKLYPKKEDRPTLFLHFRIKSIGETCKELTHPFPISRKAPVDLKGEASKILMHNGTWHSWESALLHCLHGKLPDGPWSDTRTMAYMVAYHGDRVLDIINERVATLDRTGKCVLHGKGWVKKDEVIYSNDLWVTKATNLLKGDSIYWDQGVASNPNKDGKFEKNKDGITYSWVEKKYTYIDHTKNDSKSPPQNGATPSGVTPTNTTATKGLLENGTKATMDDYSHEVKRRPSKRPTQWTDDELTNYVLNVHPGTIPDDVLVELGRREMW
jgi:hypothetical protein